MTDFAPFVETDAKDGTQRLYLMAGGMRCASCAWSIESALNAEPEVDGRVNLSTRRLVIHWKGEPSRANALVEKITALGYTFAPFDSALQKSADVSEEKFLMRCIGVAGFASGNIMVFSLALWFSSQQSMGMATRDLMHWVSGLIALPAIIYAGIPYYTSAWNVLKAGRTNMDVPISLAVLLSAGMSLSETFRHGEYVYFDSSVMLLFFLLIGRYLDRKARGQARAAAQDLLTLMQGSATIRDGAAQREIPIREVKPGMRLLVAAGEKIAADGVVAEGASDVDSSLITGETVPQLAAPGTKLFAGMVNISAPIEVDVSAASEHSLLADIIRLMENAEQGQAKYVRLADKVAGWYTPVVHLLAFGTFIAWLTLGLPWQPALMIATTVLIITCPCALGLAVPAVQVLASGRLFAHGMLLKSGSALERLAAIDTVVFDKTGTLTQGKPQLSNADSVSERELQLAASMAATSKHPLARAVAAAWQGEMLKLKVKEDPGNGLAATHEGKVLKLGRRGWCGDTSAQADEHLEMWFAAEGQPPRRLTFMDALRKDASDVVERLRDAGLRIILLSGDREPVVRVVANTLGIHEFSAGITPVDKNKRVRALATEGRRVLMVGDGLNDAPALAAASVSMSPSSAIDITQNAADIVFQGERLAPVLEAYNVSKASVRLVKQNFALSFLYNVLAVPMAVAGMVTPLIAAIAMSSSSLLVVANAMRLKWMKEA